ncbi:MAG TPA: PIN domain-containing protein [Dehalococcoidia bacterium]|nr:PIN domain-containing protein [Dehalococcoidia bacterium]
MTTITFRYVFDTSAILAVILGEPEQQTVVGLLEQAREDDFAIGLPFLALMECEYKLLRWFGVDEATTSLLLIQGWPCAVVESSEEWRHEAARIKAAGGLSLADAWIAALAVLSDAQLVYKDPEFDKVPSLRSVKL